MTEEEIKKMNDDIEKENRTGFSRWSWFSVIYHLAGGDITKFDAVCDMPFLLALNFLVYEDEKRILEQQQNKK